MESDNRQRHLIILIGVGIAAIAAFGWLIPKLLTVPLFGPLPTPGSSGAPANNLPDDLRVLSGNITDISGSGMTIEWSVPQKFDFSEVKTLLKHITWRDSTTFSRVRADVPSAKPETIKPADLKVGQTVVVSTRETIQDHFELTALSIQVQVPPAPKQL